MGFCITWNRQQQDVGAASPPPQPAVEKRNHICDVCGFAAVSALALGSHKRRHKE